MSDFHSLYHVELEDNIIILRFENLNKLSDNDLSQAIDRELQKENFQDYQSAIVDCSHVEYANSLFLEILVELSRKVKERGGAISIFNAGPFLKEVFQVTNLNRLLPVHEQFEESMAHVKAAS